MNAPEEVLRVIEEACVHLQSATPSRQAEAVLLEFQQSASPYGACQFILANSKVPTAQFHALRTIRCAALREWTSLSSEHKASLRNYLLQLLFENEDRLEHFVKTQAQQCYAAVVKRGWLDYNTTSTAAAAEHRDSILSPLLQLMLNAENPLPKRALGLGILSSMVDEFSTRRGSEMQLPLAFHHKCARSFAKTQLKRIASCNIALLQQQLLSDGSSDAASVLLEPCLSLIVKILNWEFEERYFSSEMFFLCASTTVDASPFQPGPSWRDPLLTSQLVSTLFKLHEMVVGHERLSHLTRMGILQMASLHESIFTDEPDKRDYLSAFLQGALPLLRNCLLSVFSPSSPSSLSSSQQQMMIELASVFARFLRTYRLEGLLSLCSSSASEGGSELSFALLEELRTFSCGCLQSLSAVSEAAREEGVERSWHMTCFEELLKAWGTLVGDMEENDDVPNEVQQRLCDALHQCSSSIFQLYVRSRLNVAADELALGLLDSDDEYDDEKEFTDQLAAVARLARCDCTTSLTLLYGMLKERQQQWETFLVQPSGGINITKVLEETHWLVLIAGNILTDEHRDMEVSFLPTPVRRHCSDSSKMSENTEQVINLCNAIMAFAQAYNQVLGAPSQKEEALSPLLAETLVWFMRRWSCTFLTLQQQEEKEQERVQLQSASVATSSPSSSSPILLLRYYSGSDVVQMLDLLVSTIAHILLFWSSEQKLCERTCQLLLAVSRLPTRNIVFQSSRWSEFYEAFASSQEALMKLPPSLHMTLVEAIIRMGALSEDQQMLQQYFHRVVQPLEAQLSQLLQRDDFVAISQKTQVLSELSRLIHGLRGVARSAEEGERYGKAAYTFCSKFLNPTTMPLIRLLHIYKHCEEPVFDIIQLYNDMVEHLMDQLEEQSEYEEFFTSVLQLIQAYAEINSESNQRIVKSEVKAGSQEEKQTYRALRTLLWMLCTLTFNADEAEEPQVPEACAHIVFIALGALLPYLSAELLKYPKVSRYYVALLGTLFEDYPRRAFHVDAPLFKALILSLQHTLTHSNEEIVNRALECITAAAKYHYQHNIQQTSNNDATSADVQRLILQERPFAQLLKVLLELLLMPNSKNNLTMTLLAPASNALLALICCHREEFKEMVGSIVTSVEDTGVKERLADAFNQLVSAGGVALRIGGAEERKEEERNLKQWRNNVKTFLQTTRGLLLSK